MDSRCWCVGSAVASSSWPMTHTVLLLNNTIHRGAAVCQQQPEPSADIQEEVQLCSPTVTLTTRPTDTAAVQMKPQH